MRKIALVLTKSCTVKTTSLVKEATVHGFARITSFIVSCGSNNEKCSMKLSLTLCSLLLGSVSALFEDEAGLYDFTIATAGHGLGSTFAQIDRAMGWILKLHWVQKMNHIGSVW